MTAETIGQTETQHEIPTTPATMPHPTTSAGWGAKRLHRSRDSRMIAGVGGGLGEYLGVDPTVVRLAFVVSAFFGGAGVLAYLVAWVIVPDA